MDEETEATEGGFKYLSWGSMWAEGLKSRVPGRPGKGHPPSTSSHMDEQMLRAV